MQKRIIPVALPDTGKEECDEVNKTILSGWLTQGPKVDQFEKRFAEIHNVKHAIAVSSCTTGLHLILKAIGVGPGD
ncbi:DegT/DnrJ/EryC1/StrS family aminotransferase, partial [bacterium]|nr:DegT/DnrJ/EryC1/StrS family aminotransferase [bacterium]